jgi:hypothetical protein
MLRSSIAMGLLAWVALDARDAVAAGADPAAATTKQKNDAQKRFDHGRELAAANRFPEALAEFQASFEIVASPNTHFSMARTLANMGRFGEAYTEFGKTVVEAHAAAAKDKRYTQTAEASDAEQRELRPKVGFIVLSVDHGESATVKVEGREIDRAALAEPIAVTPGPVTVDVWSGSVVVARESVTVVVGDKKTIALDARPKQADRPPAPETEPRAEPTVVVDTSPGGLRTAAYVAGGVGVVGLATFAVFGVMEKSKFNELNDACHAGPCPPGHADDIAAGRSQQKIANIGLAAGAVGVAAGVVLFVVSGRPKTPTTGQASLVLSPGFIGVGGTL